MQDTIERPERPPPARRHALAQLRPTWRGVKRTVGILILGLVVYGGWKIAPFITYDVPADALILERFTKHRAAFEGLVRIYVNDEKTGRREFQQEAGIESDVVSIGFWMPDPYSPESARRLRSMLGDSRALRPYRDRMFVLLPWQRFDISRFGLFRKKIFYIPQPARIENGCLLQPDHVPNRFWCRGRVLDSLDEAHRAMKEGESVFRVIDTHWYIMLTRGAP